MNVLITHASNRIGYAAIYSLGRKGIPVYTTDYSRFSMSFYSMHCHGYDICPIPYKKPNDYINSLLNIIKKRKIKILLPMYDETYLISKNKNYFPSELIIPIPDYKKIMSVHNKYNLMNVCKKLCIQTPKTYLPKSIDDIENILDKVDFPLVLKPIKGGGSFGISYVDSKEKLIKNYKKFDPKYHKNKLMIQEYIKGTTYCQALLCKNGELRASFAYKQLREYPLTGGTATFRESIKEERMEKNLLKILRGLKWTGICHADFILSDHDSKIYLIDINPRFWGSLMQAIASGVDFPYLIYKMAIEGDIKPITNYKIGVRTLWLWGDLRILLKRIITTKKKAYAIRDFFGSFKHGLIIDDFHLKDPIPFLIYPLKKLGQIIAKRTFSPSRGGF
ncbi:MAG: ATP-grasp domain-containing protein [Candidatus Hodarchaeota archaeon]